MIFRFLPNVRRLNKTAKSAKKCKSQNQLKSNIIINKTAIKSNAEILSIYN